MKWVFPVKWSYPVVTRKSPRSLQDMELDTLPMYPFIHIHFYVPQDIESKKIYKILLKFLIFSCFILNLLCLIRYNKL